jgi:nucleoside recognition membrane protein YjiH
MYRIDFGDIAFFIFVFLLWLWVGSNVEHWLKKDRKRVQFNWMRLILNVSAVAVCILIAIIAGSSAIQAEPPVTGRGVAIAGLVWSLLLAFVFASALRLQLLGRNRL